MERNSTVFFCSLIVGMLMGCLLFIDASMSRRIDKEQLLQRRKIVKTLALTDLCLFTEARYTRHPSMADLHSPFQDHPMSFEHFPTGSLISPPPHLQSYDNK